MTDRRHSVPKARPIVRLAKNQSVFTEARDSEWQWYQLGHMQICTLPQTDNHAITSPLSFFTGRMTFLPPCHSIGSILI